MTAPSINDSESLSEAVELVLVDKTLCLSKEETLIFVTCLAMTFPVSLIHVGRYVTSVTQCIVDGATCACARCGLCILGVYELNDAQRP